MPLDPLGGIGCECRYLQTWREPEWVSGAEVGRRDWVGGHPVFDASGGLRFAASYFCLRHFDYVLRGPGNRVFYCAERGLRRGGLDGLGAQCLFGLGLPLGQYGCIGRATLLG